MCDHVAHDHPYATRPPYYSHFVARSYENQCWLLTADWIFPNDAHETCPGHTVVYDSDGREMIRSHANEEQLLTYSIDFNALKHTKGKRVTSSNALPDLTFRKKTF